MLIDFPGFSYTNFLWIWEILWTAFDGNSQYLNSLSIRQSLNRCRRQASAELCDLQGKIKIKIECSHAFNGWMLDDLSNKTKNKPKTTTKTETRRTLNLISSRQNVKFDRKNYVWAKTKSQTKNRSKLKLNLCGVLFFLFGFCISTRANRKSMFMFKLIIIQESRAT